MYLKKIELKGFKSFADRTVIDFEEGVTAIVGPNGSGKSNITEALRWVLGEQSAKSLRGGKMHDVIFAGSEARKPLNIAEVTVVLDNQDRYFEMDFSEVSITRRISRNGDSDFYINKKASRLKDIQELFMDSGLGKESFSIISQGKVEAIFNSKPEERRGIFEEAAGVLKYKSKKQQAERKLLETQDNLERLEDIIYELEEQLAPLEEQSKIAKQYQSLYKDLVELDTSVSVAAIRENKEKFEQLSVEFTALEEESKRQESAAIQLENQLMLKRNERDNQERELDKVQNQLLQITQSLTEAQGDERVLQKESENTSETAEKLESDLEEVQGNLRKLAEEINQIAEDLNDKEDERALLEEKLEEKEAQLAELSKSTKELLDELRAELLALTTKESNAQKDLHYQEERYKEESKKNEDKILHYEQLKNQMGMAKEKETSLSLVLEEKTQEVQKQLELYTQEKDKLNQLQEEQTQAQNTMYACMNETTQIKSRHKSLKEIQESYQGYFQGVKSVLQKREELGGIVGSVAEVIDVDKDHALAIETALSGATQHIIVEDENAAKRAITMLKQNRSGRATLLPLTTIKARQINEVQLDGLKKMPGFIDIGSNLVRYPERVSNILKNLLGLVIVADNLENATQIARTIRFQFKVVSLDGSVMNPGGSMTGGAAGNARRSSLFSQNDEINELEEKIQALANQQIQAEQALKLAQEKVQEQQALMDELRAAGEEKRLSENQAQNDLAQASEKFRELENQLDQFEKETAELGDFLRDYEERRRLAEDEIDTISTQKIEIEKQIAQSDEAALAQENERNKVQAEVYELKNKIALLDKDYDDQTDKLTQKSKEQKELNTKRFELETTLRNMENKSSEQVLTSDQIKERLQQLESKKAELELEKTESKKTLDLQKEEIAQIEETQKTLNTQIQEIERKKNKAEVAKNRYDVALDNLLNYLQEEYSLTFEMAEIQSQPIENINQAKEQVKELKRAIENLGPVNISAIEQFAQVNERYEFLTTQRDDLLAAKESLFEVMEDMDGEVVRRFEETFKEIRKKFQKTFPSMFGGGRADLVLTDPEDLLNTGISIEAQPPGKKMQSLTLLSGGERALTAIALLFSIIQVRPVPFCVLDEVEAALDEANVTRFGHYLSHFEDNTQFIVVTHRKGTMEAANILYGVTMQESGISKLVSVRFEEVENSTEFA